MPTIDVKGNVHGAGGRFSQKSSAEKATKDKPRKYELGEEEDVAEKARRDFAIRVAQAFKNRLEGIK